MKWKFIWCRHKTNCMIDNLNSPSNLHTGTVNLSLKGINIPKSPLSHRPRIRWSTLRRNKIPLPPQSWERSNLMFAQKRLKINKRIRIRWQQKRRYGTAETPRRRRCDVTLSCACDIPAWFAYRLFTFIRAILLGIFAFCRRFANNYSLLLRCLLFIYNSRVTAVFVFIIGSHQK